MKKKYTIAVIIGIFTAIITLIFLYHYYKTASQTSVNAIHPLSNRDPKVGLSPDERFGELFDSVQLSSTFTDAQKFLDYIPLTTTDSILDAFKEAKKNPDFSLQSFINQWFITPPPVKNVYESTPNDFLEDHIIGLYKTLSRPADTANLSSLLPLAKPYIVQSGQAKELYYWDSYFTMLGLQAAHRAEDMENMVENFAHLINTEGFIPSGNRTYYMTRSQPPFFACMVQLLAEEKGKDIIKKYLPEMEKEYAYWMDGAEKDVPKSTVCKKHVVYMDGNTLNRYWDKSDKPRPENYKQDRETAKLSNKPAAETYKDIRGSAESGWEWSSRWLLDKGNYASVHTSDIVPIDLNTLLYNLEMTISKGKILEKKYTEASDFEKKASRRREALMRYCWSESKGMFFDFDFSKYRQTDVVSAAMAYPLFFKMITKRESDRLAAAIDQNLVRPGGIVTTTNKSGQDWDAPNGFAPIQWITIKGLRNYGHDAAANDIKQRWLNLTIKVYKSTGKLLEKYNVEDMTIENGGGNYAFQDGFGWTNGVLLKLLTEK